jgi:autoinducer 2-degrading protein
MYVVCVTVMVKQGHENDFIAATERNHLGTLREPGALRFDVLQAEDDPSRFFLYEVYRTRDDFKAHQQTEHYLAWREEVAGWMAEKRVGLKHNSLFPPDHAF